MLGRIISGDGSWCFTKSCIGKAKLIVGIPACRFSFSMDAYLPGNLIYLAKYRRFLGLSEPHYIT